MRRHLDQHLYKYGLRYIVSVASVYFFIKWINQAPAMPDPLIPSEVDAVDFFSNSLHEDGLHFTWAHAVNSGDKLTAAIEAKVHGIEADVILKNEGTSQQELLPIMAHPPVLTSDLTLRLFLHQTIVGESLIKLDFKSLPSVELSLQLLAQLSDQIKVPVWLNADILPGPGNPETTPVDALSFLMKVESSGFSHYTLSVGWTTSTDSMEPYSWSHVYEMYSQLRPRIPSTQRVTFPVNVSLLKGSIIPLKWLCEQFDASLTIWQSKPEAPVDLSELVYARMKFPKNRIYYDLREESMAEFVKLADDNSSLTDAHRTREKYSYNSDQWIIKVSNRESRLLVGDDVLWLSGPDAQIISSYKVGLEHTVTIKGSVTFLPTSGDKSNLQIFLFGRQHLTNHPSGIRCSVDSAGRMIIAADHLETNGLYIDNQVSAAQAPCYQFHLTISGYNIEFSASAPKFNCPVMQELVNPKTLKVTLDKEELVTPFPIIIRNSRSESYAIAEQLKLETS